MLWMQALRDEAGSHPFKWMERVVAPESPIRKKLYITVSE